MALSWWLLNLGNDVADFNVTCEDVNKVLLQMLKSFPPIAKKREIIDLSGDDGQSPVKKKKRCVFNVWNDKMLNVLLEGRN